ncbi:thermonuclease family protein [Candidatus Daviesbacteria bacterium]|nr:thermonuclease family protein [Candidatus Daviesbacteria bacterium]
MEKCLHRYLLISSLLIILGLVFLWFGLKPEAIPQQEISPTPLVEEIPIATESAVVGIAGEKTLVTKVVDGDTIVVNGQITVRFIGIDTPETIDPRRPVGCFGKEASNETKNLLTGREVVLQKDVSDTDKYKRILRYVFLPLENGQILFVNDYLVRVGFAKVYTYPPDVKFDSQFRQAEKEAKEAKRGLWGRCS